jgi:hypothetical protein
VRKRGGIFREVLASVVLVALLGVKSLAASDAEGSPKAPSFSESKAQLAFTLGIANHTDKLTPPGGFSKWRPSYSALPAGENEAIRCGECASTGSIRLEPILFRRPCLVGVVELRL